MSNRYMRVARELHDAVEHAGDVTFKGPEPHARWRDHRALLERAATELRHADAFERFTGGAFEELMTLVADLLVLYPDLDWSEALVSAVDEIQLAREGGR